MNKKQLCYKNATSAMTAIATELNSSK